MRRQWTDSDVKAELLGVCASLGHFPSNTELRVLGRSDLSCQVTRRGGFVFWSNKVGIGRNYSDSDFGWAGEAAVLRQIESHGLSAKRAGGTRAPFDILVEDRVRVDVKNANFASYPMKGNAACSGWFYRIGKLPQADIIALHQFDTGDTYIIPWRNVTSSNVTITPNGKYKRYRNAWWILELFVRNSEKVDCMLSTTFQLEPSHA